jgi:hypothetical protein
MMGDSVPVTTKPVEPSSVDAAASEACTKSGAFAVLLSLILVSLFFAWWQSQYENELGRYLSLRLNLVTALEALDNDVYWRAYKEREPKAESKSLEELLALPLVSSQYLHARAPTGGSDSSSTASTASVPSVRIGDASSRAVLNRAVVARDHLTSDSGGISLSSETLALDPDKLAAPAPPQNVSVAFLDPLPELVAIADYLKALNDPYLLSIREQVSAYFNYTIYRWSLKLSKTVDRNVPALTYRSLPGAKDAEVKGFPQTADGDEILKGLTIQDVRELAAYEMPKTEEPVRLTGPSGKEIDVSLGAFPRNVRSAIIFTLALLLFTVVYFRAFLGEAVSSPSFPVSGTLFGAFSRTRLLRNGFRLALWFPLLASLPFLLLGGWGAVSKLYFRSVLMAILSILIGFTIFSCHHVLRRAGYFSTKVIPPLQPSPGCTEVTQMPTELRDEEVQGEATD